MITKISKLLLALCVMSFSVCAYCESSQDNAGEVSVSTSAFQWRTMQSNLPYEEELIFDVYWKFIKVGKGTLEIKGFEEINGRTAYHIYSQAKSSVFFDNFFEVRDVNQSWLDVESLCSLRYLSNISEGGWKKYEQVDFDHQNEKFALDDDGTMKGGDTVRWVQDVISSLYFFRTLDLNVGMEYVFDAHSGDQTWPLKTIVTGREKVEVKAGTFDCLILEPVIRENKGIFSSKGRLQVWVTDDEDKMPVKMKTKIPVGSIVAELASYNSVTQGKINQEKIIKREIFKNADKTN